MEEHSREGTGAAGSGQALTHSGRKVTQNPVRKRGNTEESGVESDMGKIPPEIIYPNVSITTYEYAPPLTLPESGSSANLIANQFLGPPITEHTHFLFGTPE